MACLILLWPIPEDDEGPVYRASSINHLIQKFPSYCHMDRLLSQIIAYKLDICLNKRSYFYFFREAGETFRYLDTIHS